MNLQTRLSLTTASTAILALIVVLLVSSYAAKTTLEEAAREKLAAVESSRYRALQHYLDTIQAELWVLALAPSTSASLNGFSQAYAQLGENAQIQLQQRYVAANDLPRQERDRFETTGTANAYDKAHQQYHERYRNRHRLYAWDDLLLVDPQGNVVYSVLKEKDFATNLRSGPWRDSGLARAALPLLDSPTPGVTGFADFSHYEPSNGLAAAFIAQPVFDAQNQRFVGVIAAQLPSRPLNDLMQDKTGLGESGETFLVGKDGWMLTDSRFAAESTTLRKQLKTAAVQRVLAGEDGQIVAPDYRGELVTVSFKPLQPYPGALGETPRWGLIAKIDQAEALRGLEHQRQALLMAGLLLALIASLFGAWAARGVSRPIMGMQRALVKLAHGEPAPVPGLERSDEIGSMAQAVESFRQMSEQIERSHWLNEHLAGLTNLVTSQFTMKEVPDAILNYFCQTLDVPVAALYLYDKQQVYSRAGMHGLARRSQAEDHFPPGVGLVGQCARDRQAVILSPVPEGLAVISAGLTEFAPRELVLYPIPHKNEVLGVLELATLRNLSPRQHEFLTAAAASLGLHLANLQAAEHNLSLLNETRLQAEVLAEQRQKIEEASRYARSLLEASLDPLVTISAEGLIMDVNSATEKVTGVSRSQLVGSDFCGYFTEPEQARSGYRQVFSQGAVTDYPLAIRHISGRITDVLYNACVYYDAAGAVAGVFAAARDVTEVKQQQAALRLNNEEMRALTEELKAQNEEFRANQEELRAQQEELQHKNQLLEAQSRELELSRQEAEAKAGELGRANQYKSDFLANMSHELRTPLNSILILAKNLAENEDGNLNPDQVESAAVISESGGHLLTLINDILDLSKIEAGRFELFTEDFPLNEIITYLRHTFAPQAEKKNLDFNISIEPGSPESLHGDRQRITQILTNLLSNAVKFTDTGQVKLTVSPSPAGLEFAVDDTGIGIPADKIERIFGVFQQGDGSTSRKYGGSGLGLAISKRLIELMGGGIDLQSQPGRGSRFSVKLPLVPTAPAARAGTTPLPAETASAASRPATPSDAPILVVEDDNNLVKILERLIDTLGFAVASVESGEKALAFIGRSKPKGLLLDLGLPGMHGMEVLRKLREDPVNADIPVFIMSGSQDTGEAKTLGALGFLKKPVTKDAIRAAIRAMLERQPAGEPQKTVLLIEDNNADVLALQTLFRHDPLQLVPFASGGAALQWLERNKADAIILDLQLPDTSGFDCLRQLAENKPYPPIVVYSARELSSEELFELRRYADAVVTKGNNNERLHQEVLRMLSAGRKARQTIGSAAAHQPATAANQHLLLVDDDVHNLFSLAKVLRHKGYGVEVAPSGAKALEIMGQQHFDAILTDIMMPEMDGYALMGRIRELGHGDLPLIAVTAKAMPGDVELCLQAGANDYIPKPVDIDKLLEVLGRWL